ncbi:tRNA (adenosine(37)-N6)-threonylcarbamoyltransferase complex transferase subunit TsaD, partial [bacterium]|nr:tRNA (adenosine(37)-N6)-threonylcarbamoyltransferase complex transferase subunit TsaD [Candidatus Elulimicrobium humile]
MKILAIETSCDETALALLNLDKESEKFQVLDHIVYSQINEHSQYGGVVPALAARLHNKKLPVMLKEFINRNGREIDAIAVTVGPGLEPSLYVGVNLATLLAEVLGVPLIPVNHMHGHIFSGLLDENLAGTIPTEYPFIAYTISGGHTELVLVKAYNDYEIIGITQDDAAGEAFDKVAKMLDLTYPGGPKVSKLAETGDIEAIQFPRPMLNSGDGRMSFSGLKTAVLYYIKDNPPQNEQDIANICASFEQAVIDVLVAKLNWAVNTYNVRQIIIGGGVTANLKLRQSFENYATQNGVNLIIPNKILSTDNAIMIGVIACLDII